MRQNQTEMIDKELLKQTVEAAIEGTEIFVVDIKVTPDNILTVTVDSANGVDIDSCIAITRAVETAFDREVEDYELEVGSAGVTAPFSVPRQYEMNIGNPGEILTRDGRKLHATLTGVDDGCRHITVNVATKVRAEGAKRPHIEDVEHTIAVDVIKRIVREIKF